MLMTGDIDDDGDAHTYAAGQLNIYYFQRVISISGISTSVDCVAVTHEQRFQKQEVV